MAWVQIHKISKEFVRGTAVLKDVSIEVANREVLTIVGPSGCGKSTLLRIIAGLDHPSSGDIRIDGRSVLTLRPRDRNVAMVFQSYALYPHMSCYENIALNLELKKVPAAEIQRRVRETAALLEIEDLLQKRPRELSGGQRQRVAVARALIRKPSVFLFDEPLSNLDAQLRERVRHDLKELFKRIDATVVYVTHDQIEALTLADRVAVLERGETQQVGSPQELYRSPANRFVASFIGSPAMNMVDGHMERGEFRAGGLNLRSNRQHTGAVTIGIRPEAIRLRNGTAARVAWTENLGAQVLVGLRVGDVALTAITHEAPASTAVDFHIAPEDIHVFDKDSGQALVADGSH